MHRLLLASVVLLSACEGAPPGSTLAGTWNGNAVINFATQSTLGEVFALQVTVSGNTATLSGICGSGNASVGPGTVEASIYTIGSGTYADWMGTVTCPPRALRLCETTVLTYRTATVLAGVNSNFYFSPYTNVNSLSYTAYGYSAGCGRSDVIQTYFIGTAVPIP